MRNFMLRLNLIAILLFFGLNGSAHTALENYRRSVGNVVYSLENIQNGLVPSNLDEMDIKAGGAISVKIAAEIAERILAALELQRLIVLDSKLTDEQKNDLTEQLAPKIGDLFTIVIRQHGDDELDPELNKNPVLAQFAKKAALEWGRTFSDLVQFPRTADGDRVAKTKERMIRDYLGQTIIVKFQEVLQELGEKAATIQSYRGFRAMMYLRPDQKDNEFDLARAEKGLMVRENRIAAHRTVVATLGVGALLWTLFPVDVTGMFVGYDLATARITDFIAYTSLITLYVIRQATGAFGTIPGLKRMIEIIQKPGVPHEISPIKLPLLSNLMRIRSKVDRARREIGGQCPAAFAL